jgi:hypothetical protein
MSRIFAQRPSPAMVVALLALFVALGGGAYAATGGFTGSDGKIHGCVASNGQLSVLKPPATNCGTGKSKIAWNQGPLAFAHVRSDGTLDTANSKNVLDVRPACKSCASPPARGVSAFQCFRLGFTPRSAVVSTELHRESIGFGAGFAGQVKIPGDPADAFTGCASGYRSAEVFTYNTNTGDSAPWGFFVVFN